MLSLHFPRSGSRPSTSPEPPTFSSSLRPPTSDLRPFSAFLYDPVAFVAAFWPQFTLAPYQEQILRSLVANTETWVHSANEMGKSFTAALAALWWFSTRRSKVVTLSTTKDQLKGFL